MPEKPARGSRWLHPQLSGVWIVMAVGGQRITLDSRHPMLGRRNVPAGTWPLDSRGGEWSKVGPDA